jgi:ABC-2 type transport system ATP-binding protein
MAVIAARGLTKRYGRARGVDDLTFTVEQGSIFGFLGPNGAGKSTTIRTILDFLRPTSGAVEVFGLDVRRHSVEIHRRTGYLPGDLALFAHLTGREHLDVFGRARGGFRRAAADAIVERFGIEMDRRVSELSKGNRQKVGLLLAFAHEPELLVLDEPTSGLDPLMQQQFHDLLRETAVEGRTVLLSSHSLDEVQRVATRVALVREGRLVVTDTITNLQAQVPVTIEVAFDGPVAASTFDGLAGVRATQAGPDTVRLQVVGPVDPVLKAVARHVTRSIVARPADLEELFIRYYSDATDGH